MTLARFLPRGLLRLARALYDSDARRCGYLHRLGLVSTLALCALCASAPARADWVFAAGSMSTPAINDTISNAGAIPAVDYAQNKGLSFTAESTAVMRIADARRLALFVRVMPAAAADTAATAWLAVAVKCFPVTAGTATTAIPDSIGCLLWPAPPIISVAGIDTLGGSLATLPPAGSGTGLWPGEFGIRIDPWGGRGSDGGVAGKSNRYFSINGRVIDLNARLGVEVFPCSAVQIRVRLLSYVNSNKAITPRLQVWVMKNTGGF